MHLSPPELVVLPRDDGRSPPGVGSMPTGTTWFLRARRLLRPRLLRRELSLTASPFSS
eukprot:CAMPEP_0196782774 /NCGR_PEP_ID=MMETSP1104-20130614/12047_1 /TAXON_ID=33652 /ORGANISM="Cafeteria sp., Strain Caron Lab Isolate" /LENGTH=57 /DNA_ID=CAMNT_0042153017 /DNA_START=169 /DNA_END=339 /DNA_ORIENTATION=+